MITRFLALLPFCFLSLTHFAQNPLQFDKRFVECEDKWVAFQKDEDNAYTFGFIYVDEMAGLTFNMEGSFTIDENGSFVPKKIDSSRVSIKTRLQPNQVHVAVIPASRFKELQISTFPEWLAIYKGDTNSVERLFKWGYFYNAWGESKRALYYLERAFEIEPKFKGLEFELAFAYNATGKFTEAVTVLTSAIKTTPKEGYLYKELSFAYMNLDNKEDAATAAKKGIELCEEKPMKCEIAYNMAHQYYVKKDKENFNIWAKETRKWVEENDQYSRNLKIMEKSMSK